MSMSKVRSALLIGGSFFFVCTLSTTVAGFQALYPVMVRQNVFASSCSASSPPPCSNQAAKLEQMFTISMALNNVWGFAGGVLLKLVGLRMTATIGCLLYIGGCVMFAFSADGGVDMFMAGYITIGLGGITIFMTLLHISNAVLKWRGTIMTLLLCGEDTSASIFLIFRAWDEYARSNNSVVTLQTMFLSLISLPALCLVYTWLLQPPLPLESPRESDPKEYFEIRGKSLKEQALSLEFFSLLLWAAVGSTSTYFYLATLNGQLHWLVQGQAGQESFPEQGQLAFSYILVFAALGATPFFGRVLDRLGSVAGIAVTGVLLVGYAGLSVVPVASVQYVTFVTYTIARAVMFSMYGHLANLMFGRNFGLAIGAVVAVAGACVFSNLLWTNVVAASGSYFVVNLAFAGVMGVATVLIAVVVKQRLKVGEGVVLGLGEVAGLGEGEEGERDLLLGRGVQDVE